MIRFILEKIIIAACRRGPARRPLINLKLGNITRARKERKKLYLSHAAKWYANYRSIKINLPLRRVLWTKKPTQHLQELRRWWRPRRTKKSSSCHLYRVVADGISIRHVHTRTYILGEKIKKRFFWPHFCGIHFLVVRSKMHAQAVERWERKNGCSERHLEMDECVAYEIGVTVRGEIWSDVDDLVRKQADPSLRDIRRAYEEETFFPDRGSCAGLRCRGIHCLSMSILTFVHTGFENARLL